VEWFEDCIYGNLFGMDDEMRLRFGLMRLGLIGMKRIFRFLIGAIKGYDENDLILMGGD
jgi:hypothetical protein